MSVAPFLLAACLAQDPVTLEGKAKVSKFVEDLQRATGCRIRLDADDPEVKLAVRSSNLFESLDALCRAHGNAGYFELRSGRESPAGPSVVLFPTEWRDYPTSYPGALKLSVLQFFRERIRSDAGAQARVKVRTALFFPPYFISAAQRGVQWKLTEAKDADGKDVLLAPSSGSQDGPRIDFSSSLDLGFPCDEGVFTLGDFDLDRGLSLLKGETTVHGLPGEEVRVPLESGQEVASPHGTLALKTMEGNEKGWRIVLALTGPKPNPDEFHARARVDRLEGWASVVAQADAIVARTGPLAEKPGWIALRFRPTGGGTPVPFELRDVRFGKK